jgi:precorrin-6B methylase 1
MTIEIRELVIKATVVPDTQQAPGPALTEQLKKALLEDCVAAVLERLAADNER